MNFTQLHHFNSIFAHLWENNSGKAHSLLDWPTQNLEEYKPNW